MKGHRIVMASVLVVFANAGASAQRADTAPPPPPLWTGTDTWLAVGFGVGIAAAMPFDERVAAWSQSPTVMSRTNTGVVHFFNAYGGYGVLVASVGTYGIARLAGSRPWSIIGLRATESIAVSGIATWFLKGVFGRQRPYVNIDDSHNYKFGRGFGDDAYSSMPSGHTTAAFAFAASVTDEVHEFWPKQTWWVATLTYGSATAVGFARISSNAHWTSDVVAGAGVGTLSGLLVSRWHRLHPHNKLDQWLLPKAVTTGATGTGLLWQAHF